MNLTVLPNSLRRIGLRSPRGSDSRTRAVIHYRSAVRKRNAFAHYLRFLLTNASRLLALLRCPHRTSLGGARSSSATAATRSPRFIRQRRRSDRSPVELRSSVSNRSRMAQNSTSKAKKQGHRMLSSLKDSF